MQTKSQHYCKTICSHNDIKNYELRNMALIKNHAIYHEKREFFLHVNCVNRTHHQVYYCIEYFKELWCVHRKYNFQSLQIMYMTGTSDCNLKVVCFHDMAKEHAIKYTIRILSPEKSFRWQ